MAKREPIGTSFRSASLSRPIRRAQSQALKPFGLRFGKRPRSPDDGMTIGSRLRLRFAAFHWARYAIARQKDRLLDGRGITPGSTTMPHLDEPDALTITMGRSSGRSSRRPRGERSGSANDLLEMCCPDGARMADNPEVIRVLRFIPDKRPRAHSRNSAPLSRFNGMMFYWPPPSSLRPRPPGR